jgi:CheY-like chemotaxis protein
VRLLLGGTELAEQKHVLLIDRDDPRRGTRVQLLMDAGYAVRVRKDWALSQTLDSEGEFDLVIIALYREGLKEAVAYGEELRADQPTLPILLLTDVGVFTPKGTLNPCLETGNPVELMTEVAAMLAGNTHIREVDSRSIAAD